MTKILSGCWLLHLTCKQLTFRSRLHKPRNTESILQTPPESDIGYARVSTGDQDARLQHDALTAAGCYRIFTDTASGALQSRPELDKLLDQLRPGATLVVWRLNWLGRSIRHLIDQLSELQDRGIELRSLQESIDTSSPGGRLTFHIFASLAEFERDLIRERTNAGLTAETEAKMLMHLKKVEVSQKSIYSRSTKE